MDHSKFLAVSIQEGIQSGFIVYNFLLLTLDDITVALIYNPACGIYSVFDSHSMDVTGNPTPEGAVVLLTFDLIEDLSQYLLRLYPNVLFNITPVIFSVAGLNRASTPSKDFNNYGTEIQTPGFCQGTANNHTNASTTHLVNKFRTITHMCPHL